MKKQFRILMGLFFTGLGILGIFLPVLPTTPFLLLASWFFARSSPRFYNWLQKTPWLGEYIRHYQQKDGVRLRTKISSILFIWLMIGYTVIFLTQAWWLRVLLVLVAVGVSVHLCKLKTRARESGDAEGIELLEENET